MMIRHEALKCLAQAIFSRAGCRPPEDECIARHLIESNLVGHDSHGVIRIPTYIDYLKKDLVRPNQRLRVAFQTEALAVVDGGYGFGQTIGEEATALGVEKSGKHGVAIVAIRNCGHLGRIGDWPLQAAHSGRISLHFVNTSGFGVLAAPFGGIDRRLSANPIAAGIPVAGRSPIILDISTCAIAEGKVRVAFHKGVPVPEGCIIDPEGRPTTDPKAFYGPPRGAILPFGGHKGYGLGVIADILAGALTGNGCSSSERKERLLHGMLSIYVDPGSFPSGSGFDEEVRQFVDHVKSARTVTPGGEILMPGEIEERTREARLRDGIEVDETTWGKLQETCRSVGMDVAEVERIVRGRGEAN